MFSFGSKIRSTHDAIQKMVGRITGSSVIDLPTLTKIITDLNTTQGLFSSPSGTKDYFKSLVSKRPGTYVDTVTIKRVPSQGTAIQVKYISGNRTSTETYSTGLALTEKNCGSTASVLATKIFGVGKAEKAIREGLEAFVDADNQAILAREEAKKMPAVKSKEGAEPKQIKDCSIVFTRQDKIVAVKVNS